MLRRTAPKERFAGIALAWLAILSAPPAFAQPPAQLAPVEFNSDFLQGGDGRKVDLARFAAGSPVLPGTYLVDLDLNQGWLARLEVRFAAPAGKDSAEPCFDSALLGKLGLTAPASTTLAASPCADLAALSPEATARFDQSALRLSVSIPQALLQHRARGYVDPAVWDKGVPSATFAYDTSLFRSDAGGQATTSVYAGFTAGLNLGAWHLRQRSSLSGTGGAWRFQNVAAYLQRDLPAIRSSLTIGDAFTDGAVFDSFGFRGVSLGTDDRMRPESQQGYAPAIRGIARTNARVRVTQNGKLLLETTVPPGPFEIDDLYPTGYGGDLRVTVTEADGREESFAVTYASLVQLLRAGTWRYGLAAGELTRGGGTGNLFAQGTVQHGLTDNLTLYAGAAIAPGYISGLAGAALNTPIGAVALDTTLSEARITPEDVDLGYSLRLSYSKVVPGLLTNVSVAAYRHSSNGFWSMRDAMAAREAVRLGLDPRFVQRQRDRFQVNLSQTLGRGWGNLYLTGSVTSYWNREGTALQLQGGYSNVARLGKLDLNYGLSYARQRDEATGQANDRVLLTLSAALGKQANAPRLAVNLARDKLGGESRLTGQMALSGASADGIYTYNATLNLAPGANSVSLGGAYRPRFATFAASASKGGDFTQFSLGASGGVVIHPGGVTLTDQLGETIAIVEAPGAEGAKIASTGGARIDGAGYAVVSNLMPYRLNQIAIDPAGAPADLEFKTTSQDIAPRANSVVMLKFGTAGGRGVMLEARLPDGQPVPFGASVYDPAHTEIGIAGQDGRIFLRGIPDAGSLQVEWDETARGGCRFDYRLPAIARSDAAVLKVEAVCTPGEAGVWADKSPRIEYLPL